MAPTISVPTVVLNRLKTYGYPGMPYPELLTALMDRVERDESEHQLHQQYVWRPRVGGVNLDAGD